MLIWITSGSPRIQELLWAGSDRNADGANSTLSLLHEEERSLRACGRTLLSRTGNLGAKIKDTDTQIEDVAAAYQQICRFGLSQRRHYRTELKEESRDEVKLEPLRTVKCRATA